MVIHEEYMKDGIVYPSVTQILIDCGIIDTRWFTKESAERKHTNYSNLIIV